jgi:c(7)-type cytochrome triheme protein
MITLSMRHVIAVFIAVTLVGGAMVAAQDKKPPEKLVFQTKGGDVIFTHSTHINRAKGECATCHDKLWPQSVKEPLKSSHGCRTCHHLGGRAFKMKGNCVKCHPSGDAKATAK